MSTIKKVEERKRTGGHKPAPPFNPNPDPNSKRSVRRKKRGFVTLEKSSRIHKRAERRLATAQTIGHNGSGSGGVRYKAGEAIQPNNDDFVFHAGGSMNYH
jgi:hypothetical protein